MQLSYNESKELAQNINQISGDNNTALATIKFRYGGVLGYAIKLPKRTSIMPKWLRSFKNEIRRDFGKQRIQYADFYCSPPKKIVIRHMEGLKRPKIYRVQMIKKIEMNGKHIWNIDYNAWKLCLPKH